MAQINKKAVREAAREFKEKTTEELRARYAEPMTESECAAIERVLRERGAKIPEIHGEVRPEGQHVITAEEFGTLGNVVAEKRKFGLGFSEGVSLVVGIILTVVLWQKNEAVALFYGAGCAIILYGVLHYAGNFWREMGRS